MGPEVTPRTAEGDGIPMELSYVGSVSLFSLDRETKLAEGWASYNWSGQPGIWGPIWIERMEWRPEAPSPPDLEQLYWLKLDEFGSDPLLFGRLRTPVGHEPGAPARVSYQFMPTAVLWPKQDTEPDA